jgi:hypothetical protein
MTQVAYKSADSEFNEEESHRHWCPQSEKITTGDALLSAFDDGWQVHGVVFQQEHWHNGGRRVNLYHVKLQRKDQCVTMVVVQNPYISRLLTQLRVQVVQINQRKMTTANERW